MSPENMAVLKSLAIRPSQSIAPSLQPIVAGLQEAGFVTSSPSGWSATAKGCEILQQELPPTSVHSPSGNQPCPLPLRSMPQDFDRRVEELERQLAEQVHRVRRMIERGTPNQADEDRLRLLQQQLARLKAER